jgi:hypothetical protein
MRSGRNSFWPLLTGHPTLFGSRPLASVVTVQSGTALTLSYTNATNVFGITGDRAQIDCKR